MARPLIIGNKERSAIKNLIRYAENNKLTIKDMKLLMQGIVAPPGDNPNFSVMLPVQFRVVFTIEQHPGGWFKHLSISVPDRGRWPSIEAVDMISKEFGIDDLKDEHIYPEKEVEAINVVAKYSGAAS